MPFKVGWCLRRLCLDVISIISYRYIHSSLLCIYIKYSNLYSITQTFVCGYCINWGKRKEGALTFLKCPNYVCSYTGSGIWSFNLLDNVKKMQYFFNLSYSNSCWLYLIFDMVYVITMSTLLAILIPLCFRYSVNVPSLTT